jgi:hypothetical protein
LTPVALTILWGTESDSLVPTVTGGILNLLPQGRTTDLPWFNIDAIAVTFNQPSTVAASDVTVTGLTGGNYGPVTITGAGTSHLICTFAKPITGPDILTITLFFDGIIVGGPAKLDVLPGDVNDDGAVNSTDGVAILRSFTSAQPYNIFDDLNGDGSVNMADFNVYRPQIGTVLPSVPIQPSAAIRGGVRAASVTTPEAGPAPILTTAIDEAVAAVATDGASPQPTDAEVSTDLNDANGAALGSLQVPAIVQHSRAKAKRHGSSKPLTHKGRLAEGVHRKRIVVTYRPEAPSHKAK